MTERYIAALNQLQQFLPAAAPGAAALNALTGVEVRPGPALREDALEVLEIRFPGGAWTPVLAAPYFNLQVIEHCRLQHDGGNAASDIGEAVRGLFEHFRRVHGL